MIMSMINHGWRSAILAMAMVSGALANTPAECTDITIPTEYLNGTTVAIGADFSRIMPLEEVITVVVYQPTEVPPGSNIILECNGTNVINGTFQVNSTDSVGNCPDPNNSSNVVTAVMTYNVSIDDVFNFSDISQNITSGTFSAVYQPKCILSVEGVPVSTVEKQYTVLIENGLVIDIASTTADAEAPVAESEELVNVTELVEVILEDPDLVLRDGEMIDLEFNLKGLVADNIPQFWFQIINITDVTITANDTVYERDEFAFYQERDDLDGGFVVSFFPPTYLFKDQVQTLVITGKAFLGIGESLQRRRRSTSTDPSAILSHGEVAPFMIRTTAEALRSGSKAGITVVSTAVLGLSNVAIGASL